MTEQEKQFTDYWIQQTVSERKENKRLKSLLDERDKEVEGWKKHATDFEEMYKQEHREKNALKRELERLKEVNQHLRKALNDLKYGLEYGVANASSCIKIIDEALTGEESK
jgi:chromosome segregation ATPase